MANYPLGLLGPPQAPQTPQAPTVGFTSFDDYVKAFHQARDGSEFGGGDFGAAQSERNRMGAGRAPFTAKGVAIAGINAMGALKGAISPGGLLGLGMNVPGARPGGLLGNVFGGEIRNIPGHTPYDADLMDAVKRGVRVNGQRFGIAQADVEQVRRNAERQRAKFATADAITARGQRGLLGGVGGGGGGGVRAGGGIGSGNAVGGPGYGTAR